MVDFVSSSFVLLPVFDGNYWDNEKSGIYASDSGMFVLNEWTHVVVTVGSSGTYSVYRNGALFSQTFGNRVPANAARSQNWLGRSNNAMHANQGDANIDATIGYFSMWEGHELSADEVVMLAPPSHEWDFMGLFRWHCHR